MKSAGVGLGAIWRRMRTKAVALILVGILPTAAYARRPVLVELFTAQGCATCDKADAVLAGVMDRPGVLALTWSVDYWDYLGWKDTFAQDSFGERQRQYDTRFGLRDVYTPQVVVDGRLQAGAQSSAEIQAKVREARRRAPPSPDVALGPSGRIRIGSGRVRHRAEVWLIRYAPHDSKVDVRAGDNRGATVLEHNVVRQLVRLGPWTGRPTSFRAPASPEDDLNTAVVVQEANGGPVLAVAVAVASPSP